MGRAGVGRPSGLFVSSSASPVRPGALIKEFVSSRGGVSDPNSLVNNVDPARRSALGPLIPLIMKLAATKRTQSAVNFMIVGAGRGGAGRGAGGRVGQGWGRWVERTFRVSAVATASLRALPWRPSLLYSDGSATSGWSVR